MTIETMARRAKTVPRPMPAFAAGVRPLLDLVCMGTKGVKVVVACTEMLEEGCRGDENDLLGW